MVWHQQPENRQAILVHVVLPLGFAEQYQRGRDDLVASPQNGDSQRRGEVICKRDFNDASDDGGAQPANDYQMYPDIPECVVRHHPRPLSKNLSIKSDRQHQIVQNQDSGLCDYRLEGAGCNEPVS